MGETLASLLSRLGFSTRLLLAIAFINGFVIALAGLSLYESHRQHQKRAEVLSQNMAKLIEEELSTDIEKIDLSLQSVVDEADRQMADTGRIDALALNRFLTRLQSRLPEVDSLRIADAAGIVRYGTGVTGDAPVSVADREYFLRQRDHPGNALVIASPLVTRIDQKWAIPMSRRLNQPNGDFAGVVYANQSIAHINQTLAAIDAGQNGSVALRNAEF